MAKCMNFKCPYYVKGRCDLFPGSQWHLCKRSAAPALGRAAARAKSGAGASSTTKTTAKGKAR